MNQTINTTSYIARRAANSTLKAQLLGDTIDLCSAADMLSECAGRLAKIQQQTAINIANISSELANALVAETTAQYDEKFFKELVRTSRGTASTDPTLTGPISGDTMKRAVHWYITALESFCNTGGKNFLLVSPLMLSLFQAVISQPDHPVLYSMAKETDWKGPNNTAYVGTLTLEKYGSTVDMYSILDYTETGKTYPLWGIFISTTDHTSPPLFSKNLIFD